MPDGFNPHTELERIYTLRELMVACRQRVPVILAQMDTMLADPAVPYSERLKLYDMVLNRAFGKPRQTVYVAEANNAEEKRVQVYLPDNNRATVVTKVIDA
jgi:hypothetical protein